MTTTISRITIAGEDVRCLCLSIMRYLPFSASSQRVLLRFISVSCLLPKDASLELGDERIFLLLKGSFKEGAQVWIGRLFPSVDRIGILLWGEEG